MDNNVFSLALTSAKRMLVYKPPMEPSRFVLAEASDDHPGTTVGPDSTKELERTWVMLRYARRLEACMTRCLDALRRGDIGSELPYLRAECDSLARQQSELAPILLGYEDGGQRPGLRAVSASLAENRRTVEDIYELPLNRDVVIREFSIAGGAPKPAMVVYVDGLSDKKSVSRLVLEPLMLDGLRGAPADGDVLSLLGERCLLAGNLMRAASFAAVQDGINSGDAVLFVEGATEALLIDVKGMEHRSVDRPLAEQTVRGAQNAFTEMLAVNTAQVRAALRVSDLVIENVTVGERGRTRCAVMYIKSLANPDLVAEVKRRVAGVKTDFVSDTGMLGHFIEDTPYYPFPQFLATERPDRLASHLTEGRVAVMADGNPFAHIVPVTLFTLLHTAEDFSLKYPFGSFLRLIRVFAMFVATMLPALYLAVSTFHPEALPTDLLLSIAAARQQVPFPTLAEIIIMELSFELIREGGIRIPGVLGPTIGIVGAIILGEAAVAARVISPIMVIIISMTAVASYVIPDFSMSNFLRLIRFVYLAAAAVFGLLGIGAVLLVGVAVMATAKSFGVPYLAPVAPKTFHGRDVTVRGPAFAQERRPDFLSPLDGRRQPHISRPWLKDAPAGGDER